MTISMRSSSRSSAGPRSIPTARSAVARPRSTTCWMRRLTPMPERFSGILCIGDPHLASRPPGFRKDDYPRVMLKKLKWSLDYARDEQLLPVLLGDLFHYPRDNANWLLVECIGLLGRERLCAIAGNHDCTEDRLNEHDTLSILLA